MALPQETQIVSELLAEETSLDAYVLYRRGVDASHAPLNRENVNKALAFYDSSLAVDPDYAAAHAGKCALYVEAYAILLADGFIDYAQSSCAKALDLNPNLDVVHTALGDLYRTTGRYIRATAAYTEALNINPRSVTALIGMGTTYMLQMNREDAEANFTRAIGLQPGNWQAYNALGKFLYQ